MISKKYFFIFVIFFCCTSWAAGEQLPPLEGIIEAREVIEIGSPGPGIVEKILVERGDFVKKNQLLVQLQASVEQAEVALKKARVEFIARKVERSRELSRKQLISANETDELETELLLSQLELNEAQALLKLKSITSPVNGIVTSRDCSVGEYIGSDLAILTLAEIDPLYVEVVAPVIYLGAIHKGMEAEIHPEEPLQGKTYKAKVIIVDQVIDAASATFGIRLLLPNPGMKLPAGLKCQVCFAGDSIKLSGKSK